VSGAGIVNNNYLQWVPLRNFGFVFTDLAASRALAKKTRHAGRVLHAIKTNIESVSDHYTVYKNILAMSRLTPEQ